MCVCGYIYSYAYLGWHYRYVKWWTVVFCLPVCHTQWEAWKFAQDIERRGRSFNPGQYRNSISHNTGTQSVTIQEHNQSQYIGVQNKWITVQSVNFMCTTLCFEYDRHVHGHLNLWILNQTWYYWSEAIFCLDLVFVDWRTNGTALAVQQIKNDFTVVKSLFVSLLWLCSRRFVGKDSVLKDKFILK